MQKKMNILHHMYVEFAPTWPVQLIKPAVSGISEEHIAQDTRNGKRREGGGNEQRAMSWQGNKEATYLAERDHVIVMQAPRVSSFDILRILRIPIFHESANI